MSVAPVARHQNKSSWLLFSMILEAFAWSYRRLGKHLEDGP